MFTDGSNTRVSEPHQDACDDLSAAKPLKSKPESFPAQKLKSYNFLSLITLTLEEFWQMWAVPNLPRLSDVNEVDIWRGGVCSGPPKVPHCMTNHVQAARPPLRPQTHTHTGTTASLGGVGAPLLLSSSLTPLLKWTHGHMLPPSPLPVSLSQAVMSSPCCHLDTVLKIDI